MFWSKISVKSHYIGVRVTFQSQSPQNQHYNVCCWMIWEKIEYYVLCCGQLIDNELKWLAASPWSSESKSLSSFWFRRYIRHRHQALVYSTNTTIYLKCILLSICRALESQVYSINYSTIHFQLRLVWVSVSYVHSSIT